MNLSMVCDFRFKCDILSNLSCSRQKSTTSAILKTAKSTHLNHTSQPKASCHQQLYLYVALPICFGVVIEQIFQEESSKITSQATGATSWRRADVKYKKNEAFVDVIETINLSMSAKGV